MNLQNRTVVITGGTSGIGKEVVDQLSSKCKEIIVIARNERAMESLSEKYGNVTCYTCNLNKRDDLERVVDNIAGSHPETSIVINNAGIQNTPKFIDDDFNFGSIETEIKTNLMAPIWIVGLFLGHFIDRKDSAAFVNVTSGLAIYPKTTSAVYCATKAGLRSFSKSLRYQLEDSDVAVFEAVMPLVDTPMTQGRGRKKMSPTQAACALIRGVEKDKYENLIGISRLIPLLSRLSPTLMSGILKKG